MATQVIGRVALVPKGNWVQGTSYVPLDVVLYSSEDGGDGSSYVARKATSSVTPGTDATTWMKMCEGIPASSSLFLGDVVESDVVIPTSEEPLL